MSQTPDSPTGMRWTAERCAHATGMTTAQGWRSTVNAARRARTAGRTHWAPPPVGHDPDTGLLVWDAAAVTAGHHARPRRGPKLRTDVVTSSTPQRSRRCPDAPPPDDHRR